MDSILSIRQSPVNHWWERKAGTMTPEQELLSATAKAIFQLNGQFLEIGEELARPIGLTAALWQVLAAVLREPLPVAGIARTIGITRQSVQRTADLLVEQGLAEYGPNPAHRRAKLLHPTPEGRTAVRGIAPGHAAFGKRLADEMGIDELGRTLQCLARLSETLTSMRAKSAA
jgi:DNA-binding MarR family transcriptional regulator